MKTSLIPIDSEVLGAPVLALEELDQLENFQQFEDAYLRHWSPFYVTAKLPIECIKDIHILEAQGFRLVECQIKAQLDLNRPFENRGYPYAFAPVDQKSDLDAVLEIARSAFIFDRISQDPMLGPTLSGRRYERYVRQSAERDDERVYKLFDPKTGRVLAFKTHRMLPDNEALLLLGGVHPDFQRLGIGVINDLSEFTELRRLGVRRVTTHISAGNYPIFRLEVGKLGFRVISTFAVLRKIYPASMI